MKTENPENPDVQKFIDYLEKKLCGEDRHHRFTKTAPRTFFYADEVNTIFVKVTDDNLIIITDGENVYDGMQMDRLILPIDEEFDEIIYNPYLQEILHMF